MVATLNKPLGEGHKLREIFSPAAVIKEILLQKKDCFFSLSIFASVSESPAFMWHAKRLCMAVSKFCYLNCQLLKWIELNQRRRMAPLRQMHFYTHL